MRSSAMLSNAGKYPIKIIVLPGLVVDVRIRFTLFVSSAKNQFFNFSYRQMIDKSAPLLELESFNTACTTG